MDTLAEMRTAVQSDLTIGDESTLYPPTTIDLAINRAYRKAGSLFPWPELEDSKKTTTVADQEYYDYPSDWRSNSIWKLRVNYERYGEDPDGSPLSFDDYLNWKEDYPDSTDKKWANQERRYFIWPVPTASNLLICVWGIKTVETLDSDSDTTVFSYHSRECNEAIVLEAVAILKSKGQEEKAGQLRSIEAGQILGNAWNRIRKERAKYEKNQPFFDIPDYFAKNGGINRDMRGRF